jgi:hypothetical protein
MSRVQVAFALCVIRGPTGNMLMVQVMTCDV